MRRIILVISTAFVFASSSFSQDVIDYATAESKTYQFTISAQWDSVIYYSDLALKNNIDYFYLRVRRGMAYYHKQNYAKSIHEFEKATAFNSSDTYTQEMLYFSYISAGRENEALNFASSMTEAAKKEAGIKKTRLFQSLYLEGGPSFSNNFSKNSTIDFNGEQNLKGKADLIGNMFYGHLGGKFQTGKNFSFYAGITMLKEEINMFQYDFEHLPAGRFYFQWDTVTWKPDPPPGNYTYDTIIENHQVFMNKSVSASSKKNLHQNEFYISCNFYQKNGLNITPFIHLLNTKYTSLVPVVHGQKYTAYDTITTHTQFYFPMPPGGMTDTIFYNFITHDENITHITFIEKDTSFTNFSAGAAMSKNFGHVAASAFGSFSNLNNSRQKEMGVSFTFYPFGNLNLYLNAVLTAAANDSDKMMISEFLAGTKITNKIWLEGSVAIGGMKNFTERSGFVVDNNPDVTKFKFGLMPVFIFKNFTVTVQYLYLSKEGSYNYINDLGGSNTTGKFTYQNQLITGGVKWKI